jgi:hypothetical protein
MEDKPLNQVKIGVGSSVRSVIRYSNILFKEKNLRDITFSAIGGAISKLLNVVEVLRTTNGGLYQVNKIGTVVYQTVDNQGNASSQRLFPKLEVILTLDEPKDKNEGFQDKLNEEERTKLLEVLNSVKPRDNDYRTRDGREAYAPRGRGQFRGGRGRGAPIGREKPRGTGGFRGGRGAPRGRGAGNY